LGDDNNGSDDEEGVDIWPLVTGETIKATVTVSGAAAMLDAWVDFDGNGTFDDPAERITDPGGTPLGVGTTTVNFFVPDDAQEGTTCARFRLSTAGGLAPTGPAIDGEVEDYQVTVTRLAPGDLDLTFGIDGLAIGPPGVYDLQAAAIQADGRIVVGGFYHVASGNVDFFLARCFSDGTLDTSFGTGGRVITPLGPSNDIFIQSGHSAGREDRMRRRFTGVIAPPVRRPSPDYSEFREFLDLQGYLSG